MVDVEFTKEFQLIFSKIRDNLFKEKIIKQLKKIKENPEIGKPMKHDRKGTRELYIKPFRLSYSFDILNNVVYVLDLYHKKKQ
jgi:mRNA-degrading endonuclease RelE of RelBE toxin-antitoxin system